MNKLRSQYIYRLVGQIQNKKPRQSLKGQFYQLQISCENSPKVDKIFVFDNKLTNSSIWKTIEQDQFFNKKYLFLCRNYSGHYYLIDWKELAGSFDKGSANELSNNSENKGSNKELSSNGQSTPETDQTKDYDQ